MNILTKIFLIFILLALVAILFTLGSRILTPGTNNLDMETPGPAIENNGMHQLPQPNTDGTMSLEKALSQRRSVRSYTHESLSLSQLSQLLWAAQGITSERGFRTAPSAGATFPLEMFVVAQNVSGLGKGIYHYHPHENQLELLREADVSEALFRACLSQSMILDAAAVLVFAAIFERTTNRYGERGERYVYNEIGHASQNVHLQVESLGLGTVVIGAYRDQEVEEVLELGEEYRVLYLMPVGKP